MRIDEVEWDEGNLYHATLRVSAAEVEQVVDDPASIVRVAVVYDPATRTARPITAVRID